MPNYADSANEVNLRGDGSRGFITTKHEIESYLHADAIKAAFDVEIVVTDHPNEEGDATPRVFAKAFSATQGFDGIMGDSKAKMKLSDRAFSEMTAAMLKERDPDGEVEGWLRVIGEAIS